MRASKDIADEISQANQRFAHHSPAKSLKPFGDREGTGSAAGAYNRPLLSST